VAGHGKLFPDNSLIIPCYDLWGMEQKGAEFAATTGKQALREDRFPAFFPVNSGEGFAHDCALRHAVLSFWNSPILAGEIA
jgi:hypothetical protein